jgi:hypothetical protein
MPSLPQIPTVFVHQETWHQISTTFFEPITITPDHTSFLVPIESPSHQTATFFEPITIMPFFWGGGPNTPHFQIDWLGVVQSACPHLKVDKLSKYNFYLNPQLDH